jgi:CheY-like chemotaxis protein/anti-sigma regulatory factor (Ser/Thr protein kinase)
VHGVIRETLLLISNIFLKAGIKIETRLGSMTPFIVGNSGRLQQVVMGLLANARDALEHTTTEKTIVIETSNRGTDVVITIHDNGSGMSPEVQRQVFDPFFTTKPPGKGTGLGLSIAHSIVTKFNGSITLDSKVGTGTTFSIVFPVSQPPADEVPEATRTPLRLAGKALVVDDEPDIRNIMISYLNSFGLEVRVASNGAEGIQLLKTESFEYIFSDIQMPVMSGDEMIRTIKAGNISEAKICIITGGLLPEYTGEARETLRAYADNWLSKPVSRTDIERMLRDKKESTVPTPT